MSGTGASAFQRFILPGLAFKAVIIGGGYATGRELVEFFLPSGPRGGLLAMALATAIWSAVCVMTFVLALRIRSEEYRSFFRHLLGPAWPLFEACYACFLILILSVFAAAAGEVAFALLGWPKLAGSALLMLCIAVTVTFGSTSVERVFKYVSFLLYAVYVLLIVLSLTRFGESIAASFRLDVPARGWVTGGVTYAAYNIIGAVVVLPVLRHLRGTRDAVIAGLACGPLAMIPAALFFVCMLAFYPEISAQALPSDFLLARLDLPLFRAVFQLMVFAALLESGAGAIHAVNERIAAVYHDGTRPLPPHWRLLAATTVLVCAIFVADRFGLIALIANGYRALAWMFLAIYVAPLLFAACVGLNKAKTREPRETSPRWE
jgi:uncharacterized membrane protein YkvI